MREPNQPGVHFRAGRDHWPCSGLGPAASLKQEAGTGPRRELEAR